MEGYPSSPHPKATQLFVLECLWQLPINCPLMGYTVSACEQEALCCGPQKECLCFQKPSDSSGWIESLPIFTSRWGFLFLALGRWAGKECKPQCGACTPHFSRKTTAVEISLQILNCLTWCQANLFSISAPLSILHTWPLLYILNYRDIVIVLFSYFSDDSPRWLFCNVVIILMCHGRRQAQHLLTLSIWLESLFSAWIIISAL